MRGLAIFARADRDVGHAFFKTEEHGAWDCGRAAAADGRGALGGSQTSFALQSGGCSVERIDAMVKWAAVV